MVVSGGGEVFGVGASTHDDHFVEGVVDETVDFLIRRSTCVDREDVLLALVAYLGRGHHGEARQSKEKLS